MTEHLISQQYWERMREPVPSPTPIDMSSVAVIDSFFVREEVRTGCVRRLVRRWWPEFLTYYWYEFAS